MLGGLQALLATKRARDVIPRWPIYDDRELAAVQAVITSGNWGGIPYPNIHTSKFARDFARYHSARYGVCTNSGTTALNVAFRALKLKKGDEVIVPALTFAATATAALEIGAIPVFVDVDPETWCIDPDKVEDAISSASKVVVPVHSGAQMANMDRIVDIARKHNLRVVEDCAHMHGGNWKGRGAGSIGDLGCFSFQSGKLMTSGEGGIIITNDSELAWRCDAIVNCGRIPADKGSAQTVLGSNYRMTELQAAILAVQLDRFPLQAKLRSENMQYMSYRLSQIEGVDPLRLDKRMTVKSGYVFNFKYRSELCGGVSRERFVDDLIRSGVMIYTPMYVPVYKSPEFGWKGAAVEVDYLATFCPVAEEVASKLALCIPHPVFLADKSEIDRVLSVIEKTLESYRKRQ